MTGTGSRKPRDEWGSIRATVWAWDQDVGPEEKLYLLALADGTLPGQDERIAALTGLTLERVREVEDRLTDTGHLPELAWHRWGLRPGEWRP